MLDTSHKDKLDDMVSLAARLQGEMEQETPLLFLYFWI